MNSNRSGTSWGFTRHVAFEILKTFSFSLLVLELSYSLFISIMVAERYNLDLPLALPVMWYTAAGLLSDSLPLALMFASSLVYGRLVADREIMAARSFGWVMATSKRPSSLHLFLAEPNSCLLRGRGKG